MLLTFEYKDIGFEKKMSLILEMLHFIFKNYYANNFFGYL